MSADCVRYHGRFKTDKTRYEEIKDTLIKGFIELGLEPDESFKCNDVEGWKTLFRDKEDYLELYIDNCFGNWGYALDYIEKDFIKTHKDVMVEFCIVEYYGGVNAERIAYDGKNITNGFPDNEKADSSCEIGRCMQCDNDEFEEIEDGMFRCTVCKEEWTREELCSGVEHEFNFEYSLIK